MNKSVVLFPKGGLGNQIFGLAAGWTVAARLNMNLHVNGSDIGWRGSNRSRFLELNLFNWSGFPCRMLFSETREVTNFGEFGNRISSRIRQEFFDFRYKTIKEDDPELIEAILNAAGKGIALDGNYIDFSWLDMAHQYGFPSDFNLVKRNSERGEPQSTIAVHIRLGDFLRYPDIFPIPSQSYYDEALESLNKGSYDVYTDDKDLAQQMYPRLIKNAEQLIGGEDLSGPETFCKLNSYNKIITSSSTFSSVAAWGISKRGGSVVCPEKMLLSDTTDSRPRDWIRIKL